ncbi:MAG: hypothetical protein QGG54_20565, partial [Gammaproteobacteria bacterium]|nr:hypothetical protein [Gammaproteobacteria bacterium]
MPIRSAQEDATTPLSVTHRADIDWQYIEGFNQIISSPCGPDWSVPPVAPGLDFRGQARGWWTPSPWIRADGEDHGVVWHTNPVPHQLPTVFVFAAAAANPPHNQDNPNRAHLFVNGHQALTFDLGLRVPWRWSSDEFALDWTPMR